MLKLTCCTILVLADRTKPVRSVAYSPDGKLFAASDDMHVNVYDVYVGCDCVPISNRWAANGALLFYGL